MNNNTEHTDTHENITNPENHENITNNENKKHVNNENTVNSENMTHSTHNDEDDDYTHEEIAKSLFGMSGKFFMYLFATLFAFFGISLMIGFYRGMFGGDASYIDPNIFRSLFSFIS